MHDSGGVESDTQLATTGRFQTRKAGAQPLGHIVPQELRRQHLHLGHLAQDVHDVAVTPAGRTPAAALLAGLAWPLEIAAACLGLAVTCQTGMPCCERAAGGASG